VRSALLRQINGQAHVREPHQGRCIIPIADEAVQVPRTSVNSLFYIKDRNSHVA